MEEEEDITVFFVFVFSKVVVVVTVRLLWGRSYAALINSEFGLCSVNCGLCCCCLMLCNSFCKPCISLFCLSINFVFVTNSCCNDDILSLYLRFKLFN